MFLISLLLYAGWLALTICMPTLLCGYGWSDLFRIINNPQSTDVTKFLQGLGIVDKNSKQVATEFIVYSVLISIAIFIAVFIIRKLIKYFMLTAAKKEYELSKQKEIKEDN